MNYVWQSKPGRKQHGLWQFIFKAGDKATLAVASCIVSR